MANKDEAKIKFSAETGDFNKGIADANSSLKRMKAELRTNSEELKNAGEDAELLQKRQELLRDEYKVSSDKVEALSAKLEKAREIFGENSTEVDKWATQLANARTEQVKIQGDIDDCNRKLEDQHEESKDAATGLEKLEDGAQKAGDGFTVLKGVAANLISDGISALTDSVGECYDAFQEVDEGADAVIRATGATGDAAENLVGSYQNVASQVVGDFGDIGSALGEVNTRFGYTGDELEDATTRFMQFSEVTGVDATAAVQATSRAMNDAGIPLEDYGTLLDELAAAGQAAGIDVTSLADGLATNGATMRAMGFDTEETIALLSTFETSGADAGVMLGGMSKAMINWTAEGKDASVEFGNVVQGIQDGSITAADAMEIFGKKAGPQLVDAIQSGKFEYQDMLDTIEGSDGTVEGTFGELADSGYNADLVMQNFKLGMGEIGEILINEAAPAIEIAMDFVKGLADNFQSALDWCKQNTTALGIIAGIVGVLATAFGIYNIAAGVKATMDALQVTTLGGLIAAEWAQATAAMAAFAPYLLIVAAIAAVIAIIVLVVKHWDIIKEKVTQVVQIMKEAVSKAFESIKNTISNVMESVKTFISNVWEGIKSAVSNAITSMKNTIKSILDAIKNVFSNVFNGIKGVISGIFNGIKAFIQMEIRGWKNIINTTLNAIKTVFSNVFNGIKSVASNVFNGVKSAILNPIETAKNKIKAIVDAIKGFFSGMHISFPSIKLPHFSIQPSGWKVADLLQGSIPKLGIEWYAKGGIMTAPTIFGMNGNRAMIGGEAGHEAVLPIATLMDYINAAFDRQFLQAEAAGAGAVYNVYVNDARVNDDVQIQEVAKEFLVTLARKGAM